MNIFNCFQAVAFYTLLPFAIQYLMNNNYAVFGWITSAILLIGYFVLSLFVSDNV